jgi:hypothetical protein
MNTQTENNRNKYSVVLVDGNSLHMDGSRIILETSLETDDIAEALTDLDCRTIDSGEGQSNGWQIVVRDPSMMEDAETGISPLGKAIKAAVIATPIEADTVRDRLVSHYNWTKAMADHHFCGGKLCEICGREWATIGAVCPTCAADDENKGE